MRIASLHQAAFDGKRPHTREHVAAVRAEIDEWLVDHHLAEQEVDVDAGPLGLRHDRDLAGQRIRATEAIDLARVGRAHDSEQHLVAQSSVGGEVACEEIRATRCAAAHEERGDRGLTDVWHGKVAWVRCGGKWLPGGSAAALA